MNILITISLISESMGFPEMVNNSSTNAIWMMVRFCKLMAKHRSLSKSHRTRVTENSSDNT